eukprot:6211374-Pleurochrysis_carterae.AAC.3
MRALPRLRYANFDSAAESPRWRQSRLAASRRGRCALARRRWSSAAVRLRCSRRRPSRRRRRSTARSPARMRDAADSTARLCVLRSF